MPNSNDPESYSREVRQESHNDSDGVTHNHVTRTNETVNKGAVNPNSESYRDGYVDGRISENAYQEEALVERDNNNASRGLLIGIILTSLAALTAGAIWFYNQRNDVEPAPTIVVPPPNQPAASPSPEANQQPEGQTTIIERTRDVPVPVPVPQQQAPAPQSPATAPDVNIIVPESAPQSPAAEQSPATQTAPTQPQNQSSINEQTTTPAQGTQSTTPSEGTSNQTDTTNGSDAAPAGTGSTGGSSAE